jgi:hypothetical protein
LEGNNKLKDGKLEKDSIEDMINQRKVEKKAKAIAKILEKMKKHYETIRREAKPDEGDPANNAKNALGMLVYLRYLIKKSGFSDEREVRIIKILPYGDSNVNTRIGDYISLYYNYYDILGEDNPLVKVVLGPKVEDSRAKACYYPHVIAKHYVSLRKKIAREYWGKISKMTDFKKEKFKYLEAYLEDTQSDNKNTQEFVEDFFAKDTPRITFVQSRAPLA